MQAEFFAIQGLVQLMDTVSHMRAFNPNLHIHGILFTMMDRRNSFTREIYENVKGYVAENIYNTEIPRNIKIAEAASFGKPALIYDCSSKGAQSYVKFAYEFIQKEIKLGFVPEIDARNDKKEQKDKKKSAIKKVRH